MPFQNKKYEYKAACEADGEEISELLERAAFDGGISLVYARRPNAVISAAKDAVKSLIVTGREVKTKKIKGAGICMIFKTKVNGHIENTAYLGGLRVIDDAKLNIIEAYKIIEKFIKENNIKYTYTTILKDNLYAQKMLEKPRGLMPLYRKISDYTVYIYPKNIKTSKDFIFEKADNFEALKEFIEENSKEKIFFPIINDYSGFYTLKDKKGQILACGKLLEQTDYKQLIIKKYSLKYKIIKKLSAPLLKFAGFPVFPEENEIIKYQTLSYVLYKNEEALKIFIKHISHNIDYNFFVYGSTRKISRNFTPLTYKSYVYIADWDKNLDLSCITPDNIYIECALL